ncbi:ABC transporter substrate-binding protein [Klugiella xanthotipulae]|uniref:Amino acid ABC transporter substrate-binding protein (PAAT family) n=1 Tax=Klugiella xanthotipulae TaxID=244735 RepID=A0A543HZ45_9MICO|nr:ABC transporter substrate-binding protein [Klugiella xanthotipulae]TQM63599.1 amino acid ABC transporter substrate-binding protein (PAAT family) [Klugiella xanthotipulae]
MANKKKIAVVVAGVAAFTLVGGGIFAAVSAGSRGADAPATTPPAAEYNLTADQDRVRSDAIPAAVDQLAASGFTPITPGTLTVAVAPFSPPLAFIADDDSTLVGSETDIAQLIADGLDLDLKLVTVNWADWPLGVQSGKYDLVTSNVGVTEERKELFDFATYRRGLHAFTVANDSPIDSITTAKDVAGLRIIVGSGTNQEKILQAWNETNLAAGLKPVECVYFDDEASGILALTSGRVDALLGPNPQGVYREKTAGSTRVVGTVEAGWPAISDVGAVTARGNGLIEPVHTVLAQLIADGTLATAMDRWDLADEVLSESQVNPAGLPKPTT